MKLLTADVHRRYKHLTQESCILLLFLTAGTLDKQVLAKRLGGGNDVFSCDEVVKARVRTSGDVVGMNGTIESPGFPKPYPEWLQCRIDLRAPHRHRVQLLFTDFLLFHPINSSRNCDGMDNLSVFEGLRPRIKLGMFCGPGLPPPIMSSGTYLSLVFMSYTSGPDIIGYRATYRFIRNFGMETGFQLEKYPCAFEYNSTDYPEGEIHSPNPGGNYPRNTECHYIFRGEPQQRVRLDFKYFDVEGMVPCSGRSESDYLEFSGFQNSRDGRLPRRCGRFAPKVVESEGPYSRVTFHSNHKLDGTGFAASFKFVESQQSQWQIQTLSVAAAGGQSLLPPVAMVTLLAFKYFVVSTEDMWW